MNDQLLNLTNLKYFSDAVKLGGVSAAAKANFVTQSAISQGIAKLEKVIGKSLVAHHPKCFRLTPEGEILFNHSIDLLKRAGELKECFNQEETMGSLEFACTHSIALALIPQYLEKFQQQYPDVKIHFRIGRNEQIKQLLKQGAIDFGILPDEGDLDAFEKRTIYKGWLRHYAAGSVPARAHKKLGFILAEAASKERILLNQSYMKKYGKPLSGLIEVGSWEVIASLVAQGMGIGYLPDYIAMKKEGEFKEVNLGLELHPIKVSAIFPTGMELRKSSQIFLSFFAE